VKRDSAGGAGVQSNDLACLRGKTTEGTVGKKKGLLGQQSGGQGEEQEQ